ncbi:MAG TPA: aldolase/citrate lyase family protein [Vicinamibacterales bacterium]|nr:aldolase/citrate lyase family protein [Vicinamibacterales bacterium]
MTLPERLRTGSPLVTTFSMIASPMIVELLARAGFDAVVLDAEHGPLGPESLNVLIPAARAANLPPIVRVRANEPSLIGAALDVGAAGVIVPQIESAAAAAAAVSAARFAPDGRRGVNPYVRAAGYAAGVEWYPQANRETAVLVMVEGAAGIAALPEILAVPGLDGIFIGPFDLSQALGRPGDVEHPEVVARVTAIVAAAQARHVATGIFAPTPALARRWLDLGVRLVAVSFDTALALDGFRAARQAVRGPGDTPRVLP